MSDAPPPYPGTYDQSAPPYPPPNTVYPDQYDPQKTGGPQGYGPPPSGYAPPPGPPGGYAPQQGPPGGYAPPPGGYAPPPGAPGGYAPQPAGYGGAAPGYNHSTVVVTQPTLTVVQQFRETPVHTACPHCRAEVVTGIHYESGTFAWVVCCVLWWVGCGLGCCLIPFCMDGCKDVIHTCPNCRQQVARYSRM